MDEYLGIIKIFGGNFAPKGWLDCNGQLLSIAQNTALFAILGTTYGGDGVTTFALPNLQGVAPIGIGNSPYGNYVEGQKGGNSTATLTIANMPAHTHPVMGTVQVQCNGDSSGTSEPQGNYPGLTGTNSYNSAPNDVMGNARVSLTNGIQGGSQPFSTQSPYIAMRYIICTQGLFPSRP